MKVSKRFFNSSGKSLIELLMALFIIGMTLTAVITVFMSGSSAVVSSWDSTEANLLATNVMEGLKAKPYDSIAELDNDTDGNFSVISFQSLVPADEELMDKYKQYKIQLRLMPYNESTKIANLIQIEVEVCKDFEGNNKCLKKSSLIRKGDSS